MGAGGITLILRVAHANDPGKSSPFPETGTQDQADNSRRSEQNNATDNTIPPREKMSMPVSYHSARLASSIILKKTLWLSVD